MPAVVPLATFSAMIISIPHSATRALRAYLSQPPNAQPKYTHFGITTDVRIFSPVWGPVDIPIRNPIDIAVSWHARYWEKQSKGRTPRELIKGFEQMFRYIKEHSDEVTLWQVEILPYNEESRGPKSAIREAPVPFGPYVDATLEFLNRDSGWGPIARNFYSQFYLPLPLTTI